MLDQRPELADALSDQLACLDHVGPRILAPAVSLRHRIPQGHPADPRYELHEPSSSGETDPLDIPGFSHRCRSRYPVGFCFACIIRRK